MPIQPITDTVDVFRLTRTGNKDAYGVTPVLTGLDCTITPAGSDIVAVYGGNPSLAMYEIFTGEAVTLKNGDKLVSGSTEYIVQGVPQVVDNRYMYYQKMIGVQAV